MMFNYPSFSLIFTLLVVDGAVNSLNIINGFNGLLSGYSILKFLAIGYVSYSLGDDMIMQLSLILAASIFGFFVHNFPLVNIFIYKYISSDRFKFNH